jgi:hypothetical protein
MTRFLRTYRDWEGEGAAPYCYRVFVCFRFCMSDPLYMYSILFVKFKPKSTETIVISVRTLFMLRRTRHSVNIVKTAENVPKFYKLVFNPNFHPIF